METRGWRPEGGALIKVKGLQAIWNFISKFATTIITRDFFCGESCNGAMAASRVSTYGFLIGSLRAVECAIAGLLAAQDRMLLKATSAWNVLNGGYEEVRNADKNEDEEQPKTFSEKVLKVMSSASDVAAAAKEGVAFMPKECVSQTLAALTFIYTSLGDKPYGVALGFLAVLDADVLIPMQEEIIKVAPEVETIDDIRRQLLQSEDSADESEEEVAREVLEHIKNAQTAVEDLDRLITPVIDKKQAFDELLDKAMRIMQHDRDCSIAMEAFKEINENFNGKMSKLQENIGIAKEILEKRIGQIDENSNDDFSLCRGPVDEEDEYVSDTAGGTSEEDVDAAEESDDQAADEDSVQPKQGKKKKKTKTHKKDDI